MGSSQKTLPPPGFPSWLRAWTSPPKVLIWWKSGQTPWKYRQKWRPKSHEDLFWKTFQKRSLWENIRTKKKEKKSFLGKFGKFSGKNNEIFLLLLLCPSLCFNLYFLLIGQKIIFVKLKGVQHTKCIGKQRFNSCPCLSKPAWTGRKDTKISVRLKAVWEICASDMRKLRDSPTTLAYPNTKPSCFT